MRRFSSYRVVVAQAIRECDLERHASQGASITELRKNVLQLKTSYTLWFSIFLDFSLDLGLDPASLLAKLTSVVNSMTYVELAECLSNLYDDCRRCSHAHYSSFKRCYPRQVLLLMKPWLEMWTRTWDPYWLGIVATLTCFPFRTRIEDSNLQAEMLSKFLRTEQELEHQAFDDNLMRELNQIMREWLDRFTIDDHFQPSHGGGVVAQGRLTCEEKYSALRRNPCVDLLLTQAGLNADDYYPHTTRISSDNVDMPMREYSLLRNHLHDDGVAGRVARILFVPKKATALRTICCEDVTQMYFQKGVQAAIYSYIGSHKFLKRHIPLRDQVCCQKLCQVGSKDGSYGTLDLSEASDRISWRLVKRVFAGTDYLKWCLATRDTTYQLPDGSSIHPNKFAPMGSALCFPTMSLVIAACVFYVSRRIGNIGEAWTVYGDDIIVPVEWSAPLIVVLEHIGLKVNIDKSFIHTEPFRESCGIECFNGVDTTPFRFPRTYTATAKGNSAEEISSLIDMSNSCYLHYALPFTRYNILHTIRERDRRPLYYCSEQVRSRRSPVTGDAYREIVTAGVYSPQPTNYRARRRNTAVRAADTPYYGCDEVRVLVVGTRPRLGGDVTALSDNMRYYAWLLASASRPDDVPVLDIVPEPVDKYAFRHFFEPRLKMAWQTVDH